MVLFLILRFCSLAGCQCPMPVILATWEAKIRRIEIWGQSRQIVYNISSPK
jgi:hypothetical protein